MSDSFDLDDYLDVVDGLVSGRHVEIDEARLRTAGLVSIISGLLLLYVVRFT